MSAFRDCDGDLPATSEHRSVTRKERRRHLPLIDDAGALCIQEEFDDGNGMWIVTGVSPCGQP